MSKLKIFIAGHQGMVGSALVRFLKTQDVEIITKKRNELDLLSQQAVLDFFKNNEIRALLDDRNETIGKKIRESELSKIPYMVIIGEKEAKNNTISLRKHKEGDLGSIKIDQLIEKINLEVKNIIN